MEPSLTSFVHADRRDQPGTRRGQSISYFYLANNTTFALAPDFGMLLIKRFSFSYFYRMMKERKSLRFP